MNQQMHGMSSHADGEGSQLPMADVPGDHQYAAAPLDRGMEMFPAFASNPSRAASPAESRKPREHNQESHQRAPALAGCASVDSSQSQVPARPLFQLRRQQVNQPQVQMAKEHRHRDRRGCQSPERQPPRERLGIH